MNTNMAQRLHSIIVSLGFLGIFLLNTFGIQSSGIGLLLLGVYLGFFGWEIGKVVNKSEKAILRWWLGVWILLSSLIVLGAGAYYLYALPAEYIWILILLTPAVTLFLTKNTKHASFLKHTHNLWSEKKHKIPSHTLVTAAFVIVLLTVLFTTLGSTPVTDAVRSTWERLPYGIITLFTLATLLSFSLLWRGKERALSLTLIMGLCFAFVSVVAISFPIGYGFDSFIHKATELHLAEFGTITPKPFYYIGQYALVLFAHHGFNLPIDLVDTFLVPTLVALLLPCAWYFAAAHISRKRSIAMLSTMGLFLIPLASFIVTTPQNLANLWTLLLILASTPFLLGKSTQPLRTLIIPTLATLLIHPIAGLPALLYLLILSTHTAKPKNKRGTHAYLKQLRAVIHTPKNRSITRFLLIAGASIMLPASFIANSIVSKTPISIDWAALSPLALFSSLNLNVFFENRFDPLLDFVYLYGGNALLILAIIAIWAWFTYHKDLSPRFSTLCWMILALGINYLILGRVIEMTFLIDYERANYATRLIPLMAFFAVPYFLLGLSHILINLKSQPLLLRASALILLVAFTSSAFYLAYPRRDAYETNRGFNVGQADIDTVHLIDDLAGNHPYLVLANQSVSAAAIQEIGFNYYGDLFFYPIPTGGPLYEQFLTMNDLPSRETAQEALNLVPQHGDVNTLFYVVNNYWWEAARIIETAKTTADDWRSLGDGQVYLFRYNF